MLGSIALLGMLSCGPGDRDAVIGFAFPEWGFRNVDVALDELAARPARGVAAVSIVYDKQSSSDTAADEVRRALFMLAHQDLVGVVGHGGSRGSLLAAPLYNEAGVVQIVPTGTADGLKVAGPWTLTLAPEDGQIAARMVAFAVDRLGGGSATICYVGDEYGYGLAEELVAACLRRGLPLLDRVPYSEGSDFAGLVAYSLESGVPDVVFVVGRDRGVGALVAAFSRQAPGRRFVGADGLEFTEQYREAAGAAADSLYAVTFWAADRADSLSRAFVARYTRLVGEMPRAPHAMRHDALMLMAEAVAAVGPDRTRIRDWLRGLGQECPAYRGVTGEISFAPGAPRPLVVVRSRGSGSVLVPESGDDHGH